MRGLSRKIKGTVQTFAVAQLEKFQLQTRLSEEMAYLTLFTLGVTRYAAEEWDGAIAYFNDALEQVKEPVPALNQSVVYFYRGISYVSRLDYNRAITDYNQAITLQPNYAEAYNNRGVAYNELKDYKRATDDYNKAIQLAPNFALAYNSRGYAYNELKDYKRTIDDFNQAIKLNPNLAVAYYNRGTVYYALKDYRKALTDYKRTISIDEKDWSAISNIGLIDYELGNIEEAINQWKTAIAINNEVAEPQLALAVALYAKNEREQSLMIAEKALRLDKSYGDLAFLKENLWGERLLADTQKLFKHPKIQALSQLR